MRLGKEFKLMIVSIYFLNFSALVTSRNSNFLREVNYIDIHNFIMEFPLLSLY